jgi:hypothetical protein
MRVWLVTSQRIGYCNERESCDFLPDALEKLQVDDKDAPVYRKKKI